MARVMKFEAYCKKNNDVPFLVKKKIFDATLVATFLYSSETWLNPAACKVAVPMYNACVKTILGVRKTTSTDLCLIEAGIPSLNQHVKSGQKMFITKLIQQRLPVIDNPLPTSMLCGLPAKPDALPRDEPEPGGASYVHCPQHPRETANGGLQNTSFIPQPGDRKRKMDPRSQGRTPMRIRTGLGRSPHRVLLPINRTNKTKVPADELYGTKSL
ncbi:hypothetical protein CAPTEDRAFT_214726 [Capitella teleta]|uniref:Uncharacterized protein n=1 Tax=Capitella teleta TaxID=283909 RepID=R7VK89_CAPTE|nr:hypothetical protein CAPTEDRAFT_214726 [Capitella teleta]|eukprot:ELU16580.1 hypothetical protein CAPTEDRAFT_214726 [Capitella teleta]